METVKYTYTYHTQKKQSCYKIEDATLITKCIVTAIRKKYCTSNISLQFKQWHIYKRARDGDS